ncbi:GHMP family kinase ATP-binding protein [Candidatus Hodarchaeum mangrovi]
MDKIIKISSPGRICLFGEHQDYIGLPVIPLAINMRLKLSGSFKSNENKILNISSNQIAFMELLNRNSMMKLTGSPYDYIKAVLLFFKEKLTELLPSHINIDSDIPISSGLSSSAALLVSTVYLVGNIISKCNLTNLEIAETAYNCEHDILGISCGRMDQYASAIGGAFHMTSESNPKIIKLNFPKEVYFVIGNSGINRQADIPLKMTQKLVFRGLKQFKNVNPINLQFDDLRKVQLPNKIEKVLKGVIKVKENTINALEELTTTNTDLEKIGLLINEQHKFLSEYYKVSHPKIDKMCNASISVGALGAKMTGAGFGGSMFALTDSKDKAINIQEKLSQFGNTFIVKQDMGVREEVH